ncbi:hypothetical protein PO909_022356, partial [Leuciscus waleckii]
MSPSLITAIVSIILYSKINKRDSGRNLRLHGRDVMHVHGTLTWLCLAVSLAARGGIVLQKLRDLRNAPL